MLRAVAEQQLLSHYCQGKKVIKNNKLNLFGKGIVIIDNSKLDNKVLESILELDLSHNSIHTIDQIQQFPNLQSINLSHNLIQQLSEIQKLKCLKRLRKVAVKKNPFLKEKIPLYKLQFLLSMQTDVELMSEDIERKINEISKQIVQISCYQDYRCKVMLYIDLIKQNKVEGSFLNPSISMFPKIKKIFEQDYQKEINCRREFVSRISIELFQNQKQLILCLQKETQKLKQSKNNLIKDIYHIEESLKQLRIAFNPKNNQNLQEKKSFNFENLSNQASKSNTKMSVAISALRKSKERKQNSPPRLLPDLKEGDVQKFLQQNFVNILIKFNPLYHLLHSPLGSLKNHEKQILIEQTLGLLREKMKQVARYQSLQKQNGAVKNELLCLKEHLEWITAQVKKQQQITNNKMQRMQRDSQQLENKVQTLKEQLQQHKVIGKALRQQNQNLKSKKAEKQSKDLQLANQELNIQKLETNRQTTLKLKYLNILKKKASHLTQLALLKQINQKMHCNQLKYLVFEEFKTNKHLSQCQKYLREFLARKNKKHLIRQIKDHFSQQSISISCIRFINHKKASSFLAYLRLHFQSHYQLNRKIKSFRFKMNKRIKRKYFDMFRLFMGQVQQQSLNDQAQKCRDMLLSRRHFKLWIKYCYHNRARYDQGYNLIVKQKKAKSLMALTDRCHQSMNFYIHLEALETFLIGYRKINSYLHFTKFLGSILLQRSIKAMKIRKMKQNTYFQYFLSSVRDQRVKKKIRQHSQQLKRQKEAHETEQLKKQLNLKKSNILLRLKKNILNISTKVRAKILKRQIQSLLLQQQKKTNASRTFFAELRHIYTFSIKLRCKVSILKNSAILINPIRNFFRRIRFNKLNLRSAKKIQRQRSMSLFFYRWKAFLFASRMHAYKLRFEQFQNELLEVVGLQGKLKEEKQLLSGQLQEKQMVIQEYLRKLQEYQYMIQSKDAKYQKLKTIYAQTVQLNDLNNTLKNHEHLITQERNKPREDKFYLKYLPSDLQKKIGSYDNDHLQSTTQITLQNNSIESDLITEQTFRKGGRINNGTTFVSTFRRF